MPGSWREGGWKQKYIIAKADGSPVDDDAVYFVLRLDEDPNARVAAIAYAASVGISNGDLASDLRGRVVPFARRDGEDPLTQPRVAHAVRDLAAWADLHGSDIWDEEGLRQLREEIIPGAERS